MGRLCKDQVCKSGRLCNNDETFVVLLRLIVSLSQSFPIFPWPGLPGPPGEVKTLFDAMEVTYDWEQLVVAVRSQDMRSEMLRSPWPCDVNSAVGEPKGWSKKNIEKHRKTTYLSISKSSKFNTGCVNHLFRSVAFWTGHMLSHYHMQRWSTLFAARCPRLLWHRCFPISTFFVSHSVRIVWFGFACLPSWPSLPAWAWFMSTCQQGRPEETVFHSVFYCFGMLWHSHNLFEHLPLHPWTFFASFWEAQCRPSDLNLFPFTMVHHFCSSKRS